MPKGSRYPSSWCSQERHPGDNCVDRHEEMDRLLEEVRLGTGNTGCLRIEN